MKPWLWSNHFLSQGEDLVASESESKRVEDRGSCVSLEKRERERESPKVK